jgi:hypothetical protein
LHRRRIGRCTMALERGEHLSRFVVLSLANQEAGTVWQERAEAPDAEREEDLESEREAPGNISRGEGES